MDGTGLLYDGKLRCLSRTLPVTADASFRPKFLLSKARQKRSGEIWRVRLHHQ